MNSNPREGAMKGKFRNSGDQPNWQELVFDKQFLSKLDQLVLKRFGNITVAEECAAYVLDMLCKDDWLRCQKYKGLSKPTTFLYSVSVNLIEEFSRSKYGRPRPPVWLKNQGELWISLWRALCLERQLIPSIIDRYSTKGFNAEHIQHTIKVIKARIPNCGQEAINPIVSDSIDDIDDKSISEDATSNNESLIFEKNAKSILNSMLQAIFADEADIKPLPSFDQDNSSLSIDQQNRLMAVRDSLNLTDQERILIRMVYVDGFSKSKAAKVLNIPSHHGGKIVNSALDRIRKVFESNDLDLESLSESLI